MNLTAWKRETKRVVAELRAWAARDRDGWDALRGTRRAAAALRGVPK